MLPRLLLPITAIAAIGLFAAAPAARADIKVVQNRTITGLEEMGARPAPFTVVTYYKGDKYREEFLGRDYVHIYDATNDKFYTLDRSRREYSVRRLDEILNETTGPFGSATITGTSKITEGGSTKIIGGKNGKKASNYAIQMSVQVREAQKYISSGNLRMEGDLWATEDVTIPPKLVRIAKAGFGYGIFTFNKILKPLMDKMNDVHGLPLSYDMIMTLTATGLSGTIEAHSDVQSVSTAKLPDYLFAIPKGYRLVSEIVEKNSD